MTAATIAHALRLAEGLEVSTGYNYPYAELLKELRELNRYAIERTAIARGLTEQIAMRGLVAAMDK